MKKTIAFTLINCLFIRLLHSQEIGLKKALTCISGAKNLSLENPTFDRPPKNQMPAFKWLQTGRTAKNKSANGIFMWRILT